MPFQQLVSLTVDSLDTNINDIEQLLSLIPSLIYLKLIGTGNFFDATRWERSIQKNLSLLKKFDFFCNEIRDYQQSIPDIESIIIPLQTKF
jgi:hypothetical protein